MTFFGYSESWKPKGIHSFLATGVRRSGLEPDSIANHLVVNLLFMKHTKGEWDVSKHGNNDSFGVYAEGQGNDIAIVKGDNEEGGEGEANARLIAAAPELLEALILAYSFMVTDPQHQGRNILHTIQEAITKATQP